MIFLLSQRECVYFYKKKTKTTKKISGNLCWGFARERGLWKYICKYKGKWRKYFWQIRGKAETYRGNKRKWKWGRRVLSVCEIWVLLCKSAGWERKKYFCLASLSQGLWIAKRDAPQYQYQYQLRTPTLKKWSKRLEIDTDEGKSGEKHD